MEASLPSFTFDASLHQLRADTLIQSKSDLHVSMEQLSLTHDSLCETDIVVKPTDSDVSRMRSSPCAQDEKCDLAVENTLDRLLDRVQVRSRSCVLLLSGCVYVRNNRNLCSPDSKPCICCCSQELADLKGILEESTISFVSLPESTLQDADITGLEEQTESVSEAKPGKELLEEKEMRKEPDLSEVRRGRGDNFKR